MEFLCHKGIGEVFTQEDSEKYKLKHLIDSFTFLSYGTLVDDYQTKVYQMPSLNPSERNELWLNLENEYRPYVTAKGIPYLEKGTRWQYQMHIYESPFYYVDYVLAQINALNFYLMSLENYDLALEKYNEFISYGSDLGFCKTLSKCGLPSPFIASDCEVLAKKISGVIIDKLKNVK